MNLKLEPPQQAKCGVAGAAPTSNLPGHFIPKLHPLHPLHHPSYNHLQRSIDHNTPHKPYTTLTRSRIFRQWSAQITSSSSRSSSVPPAQLYEQPTPSAQPPSQAPLSSRAAIISPQELHYLAELSLRHHAHSKVFLRNPQIHHQRSRSPKLTSPRRRPSQLIFRSRSIMSYQTRI